MTRFRSSPSRILVDLLIATALFGFSSARDSTSVRAEEANSLIERIRLRGASAVVKDLTSGNGTQWKHVVRQIEGGSAPWLEVAKSLLTATDAGITSDVYFALSLALTHNAKGVLSMVGPNLPLENVCSVPYIEPDEKTVQMHRARVRAALRKLTSPELESKKRDCLLAVER